jgi:hypothetical protein
VYERGRLLSGNLDTTNYLKLRYRVVFTVTNIYSDNAEKRGDTFFLAGIPSSA